MRLNDLKTYSKKVLLVNGPFTRSSVIKNNDITPFFHIKTNLLLVRILGPGVVSVVNTAVLADG